MTQASPITRPVGENLNRSGKKRRGLPVWRRRGARLFAGGVLAGGLMALPLLAWQSGYGSAVLSWVEGETVTLGARAGVVIRDIRISGNSQLSRMEIVDALGYRPGDPLLEFDVDQGRRRIEALSWTKTARVIRRLPDQLIVEIVEREPMALWQKDQTLHVLDDAGRPVDGVDALRYADLPLVVGAGAPLAAAELLDMLDGQPTLRSRVRAGVRVSERRWDIHLKNGIIVRLPEQDASAAWARLAQSETGRKLLDQKIQSLDLRWGNRMLIRLHPDSAAPSAPDEQPGRGA